MASDATFNELLKFLDYLSDKGLLKQQTAASRKAVVNKIFEALDDDDRSNVLSVDLDDAMSRFINKSGSNYSPGSLQTYRGRLKSTLEDFDSYRKNPMGFRPKISQRAARKPSTSDNVSESHDDTQVPKSSRAPIADLPSADILPIPIRENLTVRVQGIPHDLSVSEAQKISGVIRAFVNEE